MKLTKKQKDIVKNISNGNITDIYSFVKHYNLGCEICASKDEAKAKFDELYVTVQTISITPLVNMLNLKK